ncbi:MAG: class I SAM-dependent methyltransferase [Rhodocyclaceae bacterium]|nr:class I SAM-dependent methyltransferase [Rhodocyclaceae bacterium]
MSFSDARQTWDARYSREDFLFGTEPNAFLSAQAHRLEPGSRALCVADGEGRNSVWLAGLGLEVDAFDISPVAVAKARALASQQRVSVRHAIADILHLEWPDARYDVIAAIFIQFASPDERAAIFAGFVQSLRPGGVLLLQGYRPEQLAYRTGGPPFAENMYSEPLLREAFAALDIHHLHSHDDIVCEGEGHNGMSALIDLVAVKPRRVTEGYR